MKKVRLPLAQCGLCQQPTILVDALGFPWCEQHQNRGELLNKGNEYGYPAFGCFPYAVGEGAHLWAMAATAGSDEMIAVLVDSIEAEERRRNEVA